MAHHDTVWQSPGAADDTAGIATILETLRAFEGKQPARDVIVLITDAEELGLLGAKQFFAENPLRQRVGAIINLEARGGGGRTMLFQTAPGNGAAVQLYAQAVPSASGSSLATFVYDVLPNDTDLTPALALDVPSYNLSFIGRPGLYHSPLATPDNLDTGALQDMGDQTLGLARSLAFSEGLPAKTANRTFFDLFGLIAIHYGTIFGWTVLLVAVGANLLAMRQRGGAGGIMRGLAGSAAVLFGGGALLWVLNLLSGAWSSPNYYDRLAAIPMLEAVALLACAAVLAATAPLWAGRAGGVFAIVIAVALQIIAPTTSFIVVFPLLVSGLTALLAHALPGHASTIARIAGGAIVLGFLLQFGHQLMQAVGPSYPSAAIAMAALALPMLALLIPRAATRPSLTLAALCLVSAIALAFFVRFDPIAPTVADYVGPGSGTEKSRSAS